MIVEGGLQGCNMLSSFFCDHHRTEQSSGFCGHYLSNTDGRAGRGGFYRQCCAHLLASSSMGGFGYGHNLRSLPTCGWPNFGLSQHVGGRRLCLEVLFGFWGLMGFVLGFVCVCLGNVFVVVFGDRFFVWLCLGLGLLGS